MSSCAGMTQKGHCHSQAQPVGGWGGESDSQTTSHSSWASEELSAGPQGEIGELTGGKNPHSR